MNGRSQAFGIAHDRAGGEVMAGGRPVMGWMARPGPSCHVTPPPLGSGSDTTAHGAPPVGQIVVRIR